MSAIPVVRFAIFLHVLFTISFYLFLIVSAAFICFRFTLPAVFTRVRHVALAGWVHVVLGFMQRFTGGSIRIYLPAKRDERMEVLRHSSSAFLRFLESVADRRIAREARGVLAEGASECARDIVISNHQIYVDWLYIWSLFALSRSAGNLYIILKRSLQFVPILGVGMKLCSFIFIARSWMRDKLKFIRRLKKIHLLDNRWVLLIFPEGTTLNESARLKMKEYAGANKVKPNIHTLLPRTTGLLTAIRNLPEARGILDLTIGYDGTDACHYPEEKYGIWDVFAEGSAPRTAHMCLSYHRMSAIPTNDALFEEWLDGVFKRKDALLEEFFRDGEFTTGVVAVESAIPISPVPDIMRYILPIYMACNCLGICVAVFLLRTFRQQFPLLL